MDSPIQTHYFPIGLYSLHQFKHQQVKQQPQPRFQPVFLISSYFLRFIILIINAVNILQFVFIKIQVFNFHSNPCLQIN